jgi:predicted nucleic-acid-binding protein
MRAIDTNLLVRLLTRDDAEQTERAESYVAKGAWVSHLVLVEAVWVLGSVYDLGPERIATAVDMLLDHAQIAIQDPDVVAAALERFRSGDGVELSDCLILETARKKGHLPLGTFDRSLSRLDGAEEV